MPLPLLRLPEKLTVNVLRPFGIRELIAISILSKRAGKAVQLLKLRPHHGDVYISNSIKFELTFNDPTQNLVLEFYKNTRKPQTVLNIPESVTVTSDGNQIDEWRFPSSKMTMKDWYLHIAFTFRPRFLVDFNFGFHIFNFESIKKSFTCFEIDELFIAENIPKNQSRMILKAFLPTSNALLLRRNPFLKQEDFRAILIRNHELINYGTGEYLTDFTLDDMLMCNFAFLYFTFPTWTDKEINRFLKLWRKGACPRLCELAFFYDPEDWRWNQDEILKGISFQEVTGEREIRWFNGYHVHLTSGFDIRGINGRICTIEVRESDCYRFYFYD